MINEKRVLESFLDYIQIDSETYEEGNFAKRLEKDLIDAGLEVEFDNSGETLEIKPIPKVCIQFVIAVAILIAAKVSVEWCPAINTSPAPIKINPKFPIIMGRAMFNNSFA